MTCPPDCPDCARTLAPVTGESLFLAEAARGWWQGLREQLTDPSLVELAHTEVAGTIGTALSGPNGAVMAGVLRASLREDQVNAEHVGRLRALAADPSGNYPECQWRLDSMPEAVARADAMGPLLGAVAEGVRLAAAAAPGDELLALTAGHAEPAQPRMQVAHGMLSQPATRNRLRLAGHPASRRLAGYGRPYRGAATLAQDELPDVPGDAGTAPAPPGSRARSGRRRRRR